MTRTTSRSIDGQPPAAAILAGGSARRFGGSAKALLDVGGERIIDRQLRALRQITDAIFVVAADPSPFAGLALDVVPDAIPGCGALGGIYTAIQRSPRARTLVVASDMPFLNPSFLQRLADTDSDVVMPRTARGLEPLCALYSRACAEPIRRRLAAGSLEAAVVPEGVRSEEIGPEVLAAYDPDGLMFVNVNTPHDHARARGLAEVKAPKIVS